MWIRITFLTTHPENSDLPVSWVQVLEKQMYHKSVVKTWNTFIWNRCSTKQNIVLFQTKKSVSDGCGRKKLNLNFFWRFFSWNFFFRDIMHQILHWLSDWWEWFLLCGQKKVFYRWEKKRLYSELKIRYLLLYFKSTIRTKVQICIQMYLIVPH